MVFSPKILLRTIPDSTAFMWVSMRSTGLGSGQKGYRSGAKIRTGLFIQNRSAIQMWTITLLHGPLPANGRDPNGAPYRSLKYRIGLLSIRAIRTISIAHGSLTAFCDLTFGEYAYGGLFLRMPYKRDLGGEAINSEGQTNRDAEGQRAQWVSVSIPIEGRADWAWHCDDGSPLQSRIPQSLAR